MLKPTLLRAGWRDLRRRPLQTGLLVAGVALGVAVVVAIDLAGAAAERAFERSSQAIVGRATHRILGGPGGLDEDVLRLVRVDAGLDTSAPVVEGVVIAPALDGQPLSVLGVDPLSEVPFRGYLGGGTLSAPALAGFLTDDRAAIVGATLCERYGLALGDPLIVEARGRIHRLRVLGVVTPGDGEAREVLDGLLLVDVATAQRLFGLVGRLSRLDLIATPPQLERVKRVLPAGARLAPASEAAAAARELTAAFRLNLSALSLLALVVGMFLIYNTVLFGVVQRRAVFGTLRVLGARPAHVLLLILFEAVLASALGALLGLALGYLLGQGALRLVTRTINDLYFVLAVREAPLTGAVVARGLVLGIGASLLAALAPACEAAGVPVLAALNPRTLEHRSRRMVPHVALAGVALSAAGAAILGFGPPSVVLGFGGLFAAVLGLALLAPWATLRILGVAGPLAALGLGSLAHIAARTLQRSVSRTGVAVAALTVAVSAATGVELLIGSFRATVMEWLSLTLPADVYVGGDVSGARAPANVAPELLARVAAVPGVGSIETLRLVDLPGSSGQAQLAVVDVRRSARCYRLTAGDTRATWARVLRGAVLVSQPFAHRHGLPAQGGELTLPTDRGPRVFAVAGVYYDYATERGRVLMHRAVYERHFADHALTSLAVEAAPGWPAADLAQALRAALAGSGLPVRTHAALRGAALALFERTFAVTRALRLLAIGVAFIGVWSALMALQLERSRELATLVALGLSPARLGLLTLLETGFLGLSAGILSLPTGALIAAVLTNVINVRSFGWTLLPCFDPWVFAQALAVSVTAAVLAGVYPLLRLGRLNLAAALRQE